MVNASSASFRGCVATFVLASGFLLTLDAQQQDFLQARRQWDGERRCYEQQIRDLTSQLRAEPLAA